MLVIVIVIFVTVLVRVRDAVEMFVDVRVVRFGRIVFVLVRMSVLVTVVVVVVRATHATWPSRA